LANTREEVNGKRLFSIDFDAGSESGDEEEGKEEELGKHGGLGSGNYF